MEANFCVTNLGTLCIFYQKNERRWKRAEGSDRGQFWVIILVLAQTKCKWRNSSGWAASDRDLPKTKQQYMSLQNVFSLQVARSQR